MWSNIPLELYLDIQSDNNDSDLYLDFLLEFCLDMMLEKQKNILLDKFRY